MKEEINARWSRPFYDDMEKLLLAKMKENLNVQEVLVKIALPRGDTTSMNDMLSTDWGTYLITQQAVSEFAGECIHFLIDWDRILKGMVADEALTDGPVTKFVMGDRNWRDWETLYNKYLKHLAIMEINDLKQTVVQATQHALEGTPHDISRGVLVSDVVGLRDAMVYIMRSTLGRVRHQPASWHVLMAVKAIMTDESSVVPTAVSEVLTKKEILKLCDMAVTKVKEDDPTSSITSEKGRELLKTVYD